MTTPRFAIVGHPNKGKSSIVATLAEDDSIAIAPDPGTTQHARNYPLSCDGETLYELIDTPGFQRAREVLAWLDAHDRGAGARAAVVAEFVAAHAADPRFRDECELLSPILAGAGILYVVDGSRPYGAEYEPEMEVLRRTGRPRMALINLIGSGDHIEEWRAALGQYFSIVRVFDAVEADFSERLQLLKAFSAIDEQWSGPLARAVSVLAAERMRRRRNAAVEIADLLCRVLTATETTPLPDEHIDATAQARATERLRAAITSNERRARRAVADVYQHRGLSEHEEAATFLAEDLFSARSFSVFGLSLSQLMLTGAASGAVAGGFVDALFGGASLLLGAGIGAVLGGAGALLGAERLAHVEVLGRPLGGYELKVGPVTDANFPWVMLGRAVTHARLVAEHNHARREALVIDAARAAHFADSIDATTRRTLDRVFRRLRSEGAIETADRNALVDAIDTLLAEARPQ
jgi:hypothetical protein